MYIHVKYLFEIAVNRLFFPLTFLKLAQDKTLTRLAVQRNRIPIMAQYHCLLGLFRHLFPFIIMPNVI